ncbi:cytidine deaminase [bacterium]|nr:cytidine deaminase [bacterium]
MLSNSQLELLKAAKTARKFAYAPYSAFAVGAAVRTADGKVYTGANVENASYGLSICAERVAIFNAVANGNARIVQLALCTESIEPSPPCGACRQVLAEFTGDAEIILGTTLSQETRILSLTDLFPHPFKLNRRGHET